QTKARALRPGAGRNRKPELRAKQFLRLSTTAVQNLGARLWNPVRTRRSTGRASGGADRFGEVAFAAAARSCAAPEPTSPPPRTAEQTDQQPPFSSPAA